MTILDLRSDTVTRPTEAMRQAMMTAEVGDDMMGEDPTVNLLEQRMAEMFGHESAVLACSGTQSNQMAVRIHCQPGDELLIHSTGHICNFEGGAPAALSGVSVRTLGGEGGMLNTDELNGMIRANDQHFCRTRLVCVENTTNIGGGRVYPLQTLQEIAAWTRQHNLHLHLDGARLFNAIVAGDYSAATIGSLFDTISICFSKGLGCPFGSILIGNEETIQRARRVRKLFGGALRQSGFIAAAAIHALDHHVERLADDHRNAQRLADGLRCLPGISGLAETIESNLIFFELAPKMGTAVQLAAALREHGILIGPMGGQRVRLVTHLDIPNDSIDRIIAAVSDQISSGFSKQPVLGRGPFSK